MPAATNHHYSACRRGGVIIAFAGIGCILCAMLLAAIFSRMYWGYVLAPPGIDHRFTDAREVLAHSSITFAGAVPVGMSAPLDFGRFAEVRDGDGALRLVPAAVDAIALYRDWSNRGVAPKGFESVPPLDDARVSQIPTLIESTIAMRIGSDGDGFPHGNARIDAYEIVGPQGEHLLFLAIHTGPIANDHYAYYEALYDLGRAGPAMLDCRQWCRDVAGLEGLEFVTLTSVFSLFLLLIVLPCLCLLLLWRHIVRRTRGARGCCPVCGYDCRHSNGSGCTECGWGISTSDGRA